MSELREKQIVHQALDAALSGMQDDPFLAGRVLHIAHAQERKAPRRKPTAALVLALILALASATALALGAALHVMTKRVAQMEAGGQMLAWGLAEKADFVQAMREAGYAMSEADWRILCDERASAQAREDAADRIVYARYGAVQEEANAARPIPGESVYGEAPDAVLIFRERFLAENPDADYYDYLDALGYWLRDEYEPELQAAMAQNAPTPMQTEDSSVLTQEMAEQYLLGYLTEVLNLPASAAEQAAIASSQDAASGAWHVRAHTAASLPEDGFEHSFVTQTETGLQIAFWVVHAEDGSACTADSLAALLTDLAETNRRISLHAIHTDEARQVALAAIQERYGLSAEEIGRYFVYTADTYTSDPDCIRMGFTLRTRNNTGAPWDYAAIVNLTTAQADDVFTADELFDRLPLLGAAWPSLQENEAYLDYLRWYTTWSPIGDFSQWPIEKQALASEALQEAGRQMRAALSAPDDYYALKAFTHHRYSVPTGAELSEDEAFSLAVSAAVHAYGVLAGDMERASARRTFSRDEGDVPTWRFLIFNRDTEHDVFRVYVQLNALTGEILSIDKDFSCSLYDIL